MAAQEALNLEIDVLVMKKTDVYTHIERSNEAREKAKVAEANLLELKTKLEDEEAARCEAKRLLKEQRASLSELEENVRIQYLIL